MVNTNQWCAEGIGLRENRFLIYKAKDLPWWMERLHKKDIIYIDDTSNMPGEARAEKAYLQDQGVVSILALPFDVNGELYGYIGFQNFSDSGGWEKDDISILRLFAEIIGNAFERRRAERILRESGDRYRTIFESTGTATIICDEDMTISLVSTEFERLTGYPRYQLEGMRKVNELFSRAEFENIVRHYKLKKNGQRLTSSSMETWLNDRFQNKRYVIVNISFLPGSSKSIFSFQDITERKIAEEKLEFLGFHDSLTGLYNRAFFDEKMRRLEEQKLCPAAVVMCDFDGLKAVNDSLGHGGGDRLLVAIAGILKRVFRPEDTIARVGGDEFAVLMPGSNLEVAEALSRRIIDEAANFNYGKETNGIHVAVGFSARNDTSKSMRDVYIEADNGMYREKLHHVRSSRSAVVQTLGKALEARDFITEGHTERIQNLVIYLARAVGYTTDTLADLRLFARFHDIGKIGVSDSILFKKGPLTHEERRQMRMHPQIGSSIARSSPDLNPIADWILKHHEWWNGKGYPIGIKGERIPLECRILAITDAYDAMTNDRPYRRAMSCRDAIDELQRCSETQFDPYLVEKFISLPVISDCVNRSV
jgi:diguanylate cyclase (GGDEF)-like protein/PAS domain S-box-containing protein